MSPTSCQTAPPRNRAEHITERSSLFQGRTIVGASAASAAGSYAGFAGALDFLHGVGPARLHALEILLRIAIFLRKAGANRRVALAVHRTGATRLFLVTGRRVESTALGRSRSSVSNCRRCRRCRGWRGRGWGRGRARRSNLLRRLRRAAGHGGGDNQQTHCAHAESLLSKDANDRTFGAGLPDPARKSDALLDPQSGAVIRQWRPARWRTSYVSTRAQSASSRPGYIPSTSTATPFALSTNRNERLPSSGARSVGSSKYMSLTTRR